MATYYCWDGGTNTAPYDTWVKAATTLTTALGAATTAGDIILIDKDHTGDNVAVDTTYTIGANNLSIICVDKDNGDALATMGTAAWIGAAATSVTLTFVSSARRCFMRGLTFRNGSNTSKNFSFGADGAHYELEECYLWLGTTNGSGFIAFGGQDAQIYARLKNCTLRFAAAAHVLRVTAKVILEGCTVSSAGTAPTSLISFTGTDPGGSTVEAIGCDLSFCGSGNLVADSATIASIARFSQCDLGSGYVMLASQTILNRSSVDVYLFDCSSADTHGLFAYANPMGSVVSDTGIYFTSGAAAQSWKIVTTANCSFYTPFETPWFGYWNTVTTAITPYVEILRDGSATAYQDDEVWLDVMAKTNTGSTQSALTTDRMTLLGTPANQDAGAGLGSWTGESGTAWSGKMVMASLTPAEVGHIQARIVVGEPSITVYADPQVRT